MIANTSKVMEIVTMDVYVEVSGTIAAIGGDRGIESSSATVAISTATSGSVRTCTTSFDTQREYLGNDTIIPGVGYSSDLKLLDGKGDRGIDETDETDLVGVQTAPRSCR